MTTSTTELHRWPIGAFVHTPDWRNPCCIVRYETRPLDPELWDLSDDPGDGPLYVINEGNVYHEMYERVYGESVLMLAECACGAHPEPADEFVHMLACSPHRCSPECVDHEPTPF